MNRLCEWLTWHLWQRPLYRWQHRNDTLEQRFDELQKAWANMLDVIKDEPASKELHDLVKAMEDIQRKFGKTEIW